jgi:hypothetical protein
MKEITLLQGEITAKERKYVDILKKKIFFS